MSSRFWGLLACLILFGQAHAELRAALSESDSPPYIEFAAGYTPMSGLIKDTFDLIGARLGEPVRYVVLSRKRLDMALQNGGVDMVCFTNPKWTSLGAYLHWTQPTGEQVERFLQALGEQPQIKQLADLAGMRIGLIRGYHYPALQSMLKNGSLRAHYEKDHETNFRLLQQGGLDVVVSADVQIADYMRRNRSANLRLAPLILSTEPTSCAISKASKLDASKLQQAVHELREQGAFERLLKSYREAL